MIFIDWLRTLIGNKTYHIHPTIRRVRKDEFMLIELPCVDVSQLERFKKIFDSGIKSEDRVILFSGNSKMFIVDKNGKRELVSGVEDEDF